MELTENFGSPIAHAVDARAVSGAVAIESTNERDDGYGEHAEDDDTDDR